MTPQFISSAVFDPDGFISIPVDEASSTSGALTRRVTRVATLDGGAAFNDFGPSEADRTIELSWDADNRTRDDQISRLVGLYQRLVLSVLAGVFEVAPESFNRRPDICTLRVLVVRRLTM